MIDVVPTYVPVPNRIAQHC